MHIYICFTSDSAGLHLRTCAFQHLHKLLDAGLKGIQIKFVDNTKLGEALKRDLDKSEDWAVTKQMKFNNGKC